jgi:hypothetical protein
MPLSAQLASFSPLVLLLLLIVLAVLFAIGGQWVMRRFVPYSYLKLHNDVAGFVFACLGVIYAVVLAFAVLQVWDQKSEAETRVAAEDGIAASIYGHLVIYPDRAAALPVLRQYETYIRSVIEHEYPAMARLQDDPATRGEFQKLWLSVGRLSARPGIEQILFAETYRLLGELAQHRAMRLESARGEIPGPVWYALVLGALFTIAFTWLFGAESFWLQSVINGSLAAAIAVTMYVVIVLNHPFTGSVSIDPSGYRELLSQMQQIAP